MGVTTEQLKDKSTATFIYDFVEKYGGIQEANRQLEAASQKSSKPPNRKRAQEGRNQGGRGLPPPPLRDARGVLLPPLPPGHSGPSKAGAATGAFDVCVSTCV